MNIKRIEEFLNEMDWLFGTQNFERILIVKKEDNNDKEGCKSYADIFYDEKYQIIEITLYPSFFKEPIEKQRKYLLHEMIHTITLPSKIAANDLLEGKLVTYDQLTKINEVETSKLENILDALLSGRKKFAIEAYSNYIKTNEKPRRIHKRTTKKN